VTGIGQPPFLPGSTGEVAEADRRQELVLHELERVPGTRQVWGVGNISAGGAGAENFFHGVMGDSARTESPASPASTRQPS
jgi:hypothetical protein